MYSKQKGYFAISSKLLGSFLVIYLSLAALNGAVYFNLTETSFAIKFGGTIFAFLLFWPFITFGFTFLALFPNIKIHEEGIDYKIFGMKHRIIWNEIDRVSERRSGKYKGFICVYIDREGTSLINSKGTYLFRLNGFRVTHNWGKTIFLISPETENYNQILKEIKLNVENCYFRVYSEVKSG